MVGLPAFLSCQNLKNFKPSCSFLVMFGLPGLSIKNRSTTRSGQGHECHRNASGIRRLWPTKQEEKQDIGVEDIDAEKLVKLLKSRYGCAFKVQMIHNVYHIQASGHLSQQHLAAADMIEEDLSSLAMDSDEEVTWPDTIQSSQRLREYISSKIVEGVFDKMSHEFIPERTVESFLRRDMVMKVLRIRSPDEEQEGVMKFIVEMAPRAFATVVMAKINANMAMRWFKEHGIADCNLPIKVKEGDWTKRWQSEFFNAQWMFFAAVFSTTNYVHDLREAHIMPFVEKICEAGQGSFGIVTQYVVHKEHMQPPETEHLNVAVKEVKPEIDAQEVALHWEKEVSALRRMNELNHEHIVRFITAFRRHTRSGGYEHYLMFEWADCGNLSDLWRRRMPSPVLTEELVKAVIEQVLGLATALDAAHNLNDTGASFRHGDIKPENILVFSSGGLIGKFKIGDWGESKYQGQRTEMRPSGRTYKGQPTERRSRLYDIWALGCITLELIVWLLYGLEGLDRFNTEVTGESFYEINVINGDRVAQVHTTAVRWMDRMASLPACGSDTGLGRLLELVRTSLLVVRLPHRLGSMLTIPEAARTERHRRLDSGTSYEPEYVLKPAGSPVNDTVPATVEVTSISDGAADVPRIELTSDKSPGGATHSEFQTDGIVFDRAILNTTLLSTEERSIESPPNQRQLEQGPRPLFPIQPKPERRGNTRGLSRDICKFLVDILTEDDSIGYWNTDHVETTSPATVFATPTTPPIEIGAPTNTFQLHKALEDRSVLVQDTSRRNYDPPVLDPNDWKLHWNNYHTSGLLKSLEAAHASDFPVQRTPSKLCDNCGKYSRDLLSPGFQEPSKAALSVIRLPGTHDSMGIESQVGFAQLPPAGGPTHLGVVRQWLQECDNDHRKCKPSGRTATRSPTRLLDVGSSNADTVRLWETNSDTASDWLALSHKWGEEKYHFSTTTANLQEHLTGISMDRLPVTFRDAVMVTRSLGHRYLWIDSLCIVQGRGGDFETEAKRMEDVYSGAYCVIAASCASNHADGFLKPRCEREYVGIVPEGESKTPIYICEYIDNFKQHVSDGALNRRGWVLQEHALARRTIFFTEHQTYFECSDGIQCETSTKMNNNVAALLGDSNFPNTLYTTSQGGKILQYQVAIQGLQQRLLHTMDVKGGFGIFDEGEMRGLLRRSLLWCRDVNATKLVRVSFPRDTCIPSWSWMAYSGAISYLHLKFGAWDWEDLTSPWSHPINETDADENASSMRETTLLAKARDLDLGAALEDEGELTLDDPATVLRDTTMCVVLGRAKGAVSALEQKNCVLIVRPTGDKAWHGESIYERVGTGFLPGKCISRGGFDVRIQ
ncbi:hypothetical protein OPT61_g6345 [Boeremia exigua]|uniref:Uncharacterized protein n=1 Tax=Boeremia exigua TaxID=749465 RepID=A0ACC2I742_9PLEO|nr:hypothetical protein OPT61_g6345 [Boeremia exigua]